MADTALHDDSERGMSQPQSQDAEELIRQTIARLEQLAPILRWPRVAYQAKFNTYGSFYATFYDAASNRRVDNQQAGPSIAQPGSVSPAPGGGSSLCDPQATARAPAAAASPTPMSSRQHAVENGQQRQSTSPTGSSPTPQPQQSQRKGPRGFNIPRPGTRPKAAPAAGAATAAAASADHSGGPSPDGSQPLAQSPEVRPPVPADAPAPAWAPGQPSQLRNQQRTLAEPAGASGGSASEQAAATSGVRAAPVGTKTSAQPFKASSVPSPPRVAGLPRATPPAEGQAWTSTLAAGKGASSLVGEDAAVAAASVRDEGPSVAAAEDGAELGGAEVSVGDRASEQASDAAVPLEAGQGFEHQSPCVKAGLGGHDRSSGHAREGPSPGPVTHGSPGPATAAGEGAEAAARTEGLVSAPEEALRAGVPGQVAACEAKDCLSIGAPPAAATDGGADSMALEGPSMVVAARTGCPSLGETAVGAEADTAAAALPPECPSTMAWEDAEHSIPATMLRDTHTGADVLPEGGDSQQLPRASGSTEAGAPSEGGCLPPALCALHPAVVSAGAVAPGTAGGPGEGPQAVGQSLVAQAEPQAPAAGSPGDPQGPPVAAPGSAVSRESGEWEPKPEGGKPMSWESSTGTCGRRRLGVVADCWSEATASDNRQAATFMGTLVENASGIFLRTLSYGDMIALALSAKDLRRAVEPLFGFCRVHITTLHADGYPAALPLDSRAIQPGSERHLPPSKVDPPWSSHRSSVLHYNITFLRACGRLARAKEAHGRPATGATEFTPKAQEGPALRPAGHAKPVLQALEVAATHHLDHLQDVAGALRLTCTVARAAVDDAMMRLAAAMDRRWAARQCGPPIIRAKAHESAGPGALAEDACLEEPPATAPGMSTPQRTSLAAAAATAAATDAQAMPPPSAQPALQLYPASVHPSQHPQPRPEAPTAASGGQAHHRVAALALRRNSTVSLQTLESGELPALDTPVGGTPSSLFQPFHSGAHAGGLRGRTSTLLHRTLSRSSRGGPALDVLPAESGELEMQAMFCDVAETHTTEGPAAGGGVGSEGVGREASGRAVDEHALLGTAASTDPGGVGGSVLCSQPSSTSRSLDGGGSGSRRQRWGNPVHAGGGAAAGDVSSGGGGASSAGALVLSPNGLVDLEVAKGLAAHLSAHKTFQDLGPGAHAMDTAAAAAAAVAQQISQQEASQPRRRSRSPAKASDYDGRGGGGSAGGGRERDRERGPAPSATTTADGVASESAVAWRGGALPSHSARSSRSRSRERRRHSRSPGPPRGRRGSRSRSRSRSPATRDWRSKRDRERDRERDRDYDRGRGRDWDRNRERERDFKDRVRDRDRDRDRCGDRDRDRDRERDRDRDRDLDRRGGGDRHDRYDSHRSRDRDRDRDYGRASDRGRDSRDGRSGEPRGRGPPSGAASGSAGRHGDEQAPHGAQQSQHPQSQSQSQLQSQQQSQQQQQHQRDRRLTNGSEGGGGRGVPPRRGGPEPELDSAGSQQAAKRPKRAASQPRSHPHGSGSRGGAGSGSDMELDDSDTETPAAQPQPQLAGLQPAALGGAGGGGAAAGAGRLGPQGPSNSGLVPAGVAASQGRSAAASGFGSGPVPPPRPPPTRPAAPYAAGGAAQSPLSTGYHSPARTAGASSPGHGSAPAGQPGRATPPGQRPAGGVGGRQLGGGRRPAVGSQGQGNGQGQGHGQGQAAAPQSQPQAKAVLLQGKAERAIAKMQQDRGRAPPAQQQPQQQQQRQQPPGPAGPSSSSGGGVSGGRPGPPLPGPRHSGGRESARDGGAAAGSGGVLYDADAALDPLGCVRVGDDAPLSAGMEPDLMGFLALSMIQFSCAYMVESPRSLFNKAHIKALADEGRSLRRKADSNREANGNRWNPLLLTLYLQSALKSMESAYGHEQGGQEREASLRSSSELLSSAAQVLATVSREAARLAQQLQRATAAQQPGPGGGGGAAAVAASVAPGAGVGAGPVVAASRLGGVGGPDDNAGAAGAQMTTPPKLAFSALHMAAAAAGASTPPPPRCAPVSPAHSMRSSDMHTPPPGPVGGAAGNRTPQHGGGGGGGAATPLGPLAAAVAASNVPGAAPPSSDLLVLEAIKLLALKLTAICRTRWLMLNQDALAQALKHHDPSPPNGNGAAGAPGGSAAAAAAAAGCGGGDDGGGGGGAGGRRTSPTAAADSASSTLEAAALSASTFTASIQQMVESVQAFTAAADAWRRATGEARAFNQAVSAPGVDPTAVVAAARIGALGYEGGVWDLMGTVNVARKALDSITGMF